MATKIKTPDPRATSPAGRPSSGKILTFPGVPAGEETSRPSGPARAGSGGPIWLRIDVFHLR